MAQSGMTKTYTVGEVYYNTWGITFPRRFRINQIFFKNGAEVKRGPSTLSNIIVKTQCRGKYKKTERDCLICFKEKMNC